MEENKKDNKSTLVDFDYEKYDQVEKKALYRDSQITLTLGICSIFALFFFGIGGIILGIIGIAFGIKSKKNPYNNRTIADIGIICSVIGILIGIIVLYGAFMR